MSRSVCQDSQDRGRQSKCFPDIFSKHKVYEYSVMETSCMASTKRKSEEFLTRPLRTTISLHSKSRFRMSGKPSRLRYGVIRFPLMPYESPLIFHLSTTHAASLIKRFLNYF